MYDKSRAHSNMLLPHSQTPGKYPSQDVPTRYCIYPTQMSSNIPPQINGINRCILFGDLEEAIYPTIDLQLLGYKLS